jgi:DNA-binding NtrC family response regulator
LTSQGFEPICAASVVECREVLDKQEVVLIFSDHDLMDGDYRDIVASTLYAPQKDKARVVLISALMKPEAYQEAKRAGIFEVVNLPCRSTNLEWAIILAKRDERNRKKELLGIAPFSRPHAKSAAAGIS